MSQHKLDGYVDLGNQPYMPLDTNMQPYSSNLKCLWTMRHTQQNKSKLNPMQYMLILGSLFSIYVSDVLIHANVIDGPVFQPFILPQSFSLLFQS